MKLTTRKKLLEKGWSFEEIESTDSILKDAPFQKSSWIKRFDKLVYWTSLILGLLGNFVFAVILIPILMVAHGFWLFAMVFLFAFSFGLLFAVLLEQIEILQPQHHLLNWLILPVFSFVTVAIITYLTNYVDTLIGFGFQVHNYWIIGVTYTLAFMLPYVLFLHRERLLERVSA